MENIQRLIIARDVPSQDAPGTDELHIDIWWTDGEGEARHGRKSIAGDSSIESLAEALKTFEEWPH